MQVVEMRLHHLAYSTRVTVPTSRLIFCPRTYGVPRMSLSRWCVPPDGDPRPHRRPRRPPDRPPHRHHPDKDTPWLTSLVVRRSPPAPPPWSSSAPAPPPSPTGPPRARVAAAARPPLETPTSPSPVTSRTPSTRARTPRTS